MKFNKLGFTPCGTKIISRVLLLSFGFSLFFDAALLKALDDAKANRNTVLGYISGPVNSTILNPANTMLTGATHDLWLGVWGNLKARLDDGNLTPSDVVAPASSKYFTTRSFSGDYNGFYPTKSANLGDDAKQSMLLALLFNGSNPSHDGTPPTTFPSGDSRLIANFYHPSSTYFASTDLNTNVSAGGLLIKNKNFCDALDTAYGKGIWSGATCTVDANCCADKDGVQQSCLFNSDTAALVPAFPDPVTAALVNYGVCATPVPTCGTKINDPCLSVGLKAGCCNGDNLICAGTGTGAKCLSNTGGYCDHKTDCAVAGSACVDNACAIPPSDPSAPTCKGFGLDVGCQANPVDPKNACCAKDVNGNKTNFVCDSGSCLGNKGFACSSSKDCTTGLICDATLETCQQDPGAPHNIADGAACSIGGEGCADDAFTCANSQAGSDTVCCIDPEVHAHAKCTKNDDCCAGLNCYSFDGDPVLTDSGAAGICISSAGMDSGFAIAAALFAGITGAIYFVKNGVQMLAVAKSVTTDKLIDATDFVTLINKLSGSNKAKLASAFQMREDQLANFLEEAGKAARAAQGGDVILVTKDNKTGKYAIVKATAAQADAARAAAFGTVDVAGLVLKPLDTNVMAGMYANAIQEAKNAGVANGSAFDTAMADENVGQRHAIEKAAMIKLASKGSGTMLDALQEVATNLGIDNAANLQNEDLAKLFNTAAPTAAIPAGLTEMQLKTKLGENTVKLIETLRISGRAGNAVGFVEMYARVRERMKGTADFDKAFPELKSYTEMTSATYDMHPL